MLGAQHRLGRSEALTHVIRRGRLSRTRGFSLRVLKTRYPVSRFAVSISAKAHKHATARNKVRRQIMGILMTEMPNILQGCDCAIAVYKEAFAMSQKERSVHILNLLNKARIRK